MADNRKRKGDQYPGVTHPAVAAVKCPTCLSKAGEPCLVVSGRTAKPIAGKRKTRTHRTRLNLWRVEQQSERKGAVGR